MVRSVAFTFIFTGVFFGAGSALLDGETGSFQEFFEAAWPAALFFGTGMALYRVWEESRENRTDSE